MPSLLQCIVERRKKAKPSSKLQAPRFPRLEPFLLCSFPPYFLGLLAQTQAHGDARFFERVAVLAFADALHYVHLVTAQSFGTLTGTASLPSEEAGATTAPGWACD